MATPAQGDTLQRPMMMGWLPPLPDFRGHLRAALAVPPSAERLEKLAFLAQHRLGFLETIQLDRALGDRTPEPASGFSVIRLAILASSTVDPLLPFTNSARRLSCSRSPRVRRSPACRSRRPRAKRTRRLPARSMSCAFYGEKHAKLSKLPSFSRLFSM